MRRFAITFALLAALAAPVGALAVVRALDDGSLVVKNGEAPAKQAVVALTVTGSIIGSVEHGSVVIDVRPGDGPAPEVTGYEWRKNRKGSDTAQVWGGSDFRFRAVGGTYTLIAYGQGVNLVAVGTGTATLAGIPDTPSGDGKYSLNGDVFKSLPGTPTKQLAIVASNG
ncbi:MAG: hypothetical protein QOF43_1804 [Gaiellaceae bacterium]|jgi:hypothetical protein|nr:hypothetical protein [Gaiellaceae bacterium]